MTDLERFLAVMEYKPFDRVPHHELGFWPQTTQRWETEGAGHEDIWYDWWTGPGYFGFDRREYINATFTMIPAFESKLLERTERYETIIDELGRTRKALIEGTLGGGRMCMDTYLKFPVETHDDFRELKKRYVASLDQRYPANLTDPANGWKDREHVLVLGRNCAACGFYWRAREWMGTENLSLCWYDDPDLAHDMMEFFADFTVEVCGRVLRHTDAEYFVLNEDFAGKGTLLLGPETFKTFVFKPLKRLIDFLKSHGVKYIALDSDGTTEPLIPVMMDAGVDVHWPLERASFMDPVRLRKKFGKSLRLWGGIDKRELAKGKKEIDAHLRELQPLVMEGGFIPTVDHTIPPDVSWDNFRYYIDSKRKMLDGKL